MESNRDKPIRILHITEMLSPAGIESFIMNLYRKIDKSKVQFDFMVLRNEKEFFEDEVAELGGTKYWIHSNIRNTFFRVLKESQLLYTFLKMHPYDIVHIHYTTPLRAPYLYAAKKAGVAVRIYHSHSAYVSGKSSLKLAIYSYMRRKISKWATHYFACSYAAAEWMFAKKLLTSHKAKVIPPGLDIQKFAYNDKDRIEIRQEFGIKDEFVLIHTGRFTEQKNQSYIVNIFERLKKQIPDAKLMLSGTGPMVDEVKQLVCDLGLKDSVIFLGVRPTVHPCLSAADCYVMPSLYEGLPLSAVEAQCSGLPCVFSDKITKEIKLTENVTFLSLEDSLDTWVEQLIKYKNCPRNDQTTKIRQQGYDIQDIANHFQKFYETKQLW